MWKIEIWCIEVQNVNGKPQLGIKAQWISFELHDWRHPKTGREEELFQ